MVRGDEGAWRVAMGLVGGLVNGERGHRLAVWALKGGRCSRSRLEVDPRRQVMLPSCPGTLHIS